MGADRVSRALSITSFTIFGKDLYYLTNTRIQKNMCNKMGVYQKHIRNNEKYMYQYKIIRYKYKLSHNASG
ncbi:hypothetical protein BHE74_00032907 [Ensete ventricosum]|nr:hypothetical protein GW17_00031809 [Ensete ventricosum]RWW60116.1 hypothetical protein BHE74_00032907 [Ensete ventricosum]RZS19350.1 hypothetical protein BHM03_00051735 [Ensete ventricosum]